LSLPEAGRVYVSNAEDWLKIRPGVQRRCPIAWDIMRELTRYGR
jgi:hypothetical protein